jgi:O-succinylbenzoic acid--CoA ligase
MNTFDFNIHFKKYNQNIFFNGTTYQELSQHIQNFSNSKYLKSRHCIAIQTQSPYWAFVALLSCLKCSIDSVLLSSSETPIMIDKLKTQIEFKTILKDKDILKYSNEASINSAFPEIEFTKLAIIVFSSGTTSLPKGVALSFGNLYFSCLGFSEFFQQNETHCSLINLPHHHVGGLMIMWRAFFSGGSLTTNIHSPIDFISLVPLQLKKYIEDPILLPILKKIKVILVGGAPLTDNLKSRANLEKIDLFETYGMTESTSLVTINGQTLPYREVSIDEEGFFEIKGATKALGTFTNNQFTPFPDGRYKTRDKGSVSPDGIFKFQSREDLIFISGGENINPLLIEEIVKENPHIKDCYLVALPDEKWGEMGVLLYELNDQNSKVCSIELDEYLKDRLHPHHRPKFLFQTNLNIENQIKIKRSDLKIIAMELYLKHIFSYEFRGNVDSPVVVFLHGFMEEKSDLEEISSFNSSEYSSLFIDLPGHGETKIKNFHSQNDFFTKLSKFILIFSKKPILYGYSMGGRIALHLSLHYLTPSTLFLESAGLGLKDSHEQRQRISQDLSQFDKMNSSTLLEFLYQWYQNPIFGDYIHFPHFQKNIEKKAKHDFREWQDSQAYLSAGAFPTWPENLQILNNINFKLCYIYGEYDLKYAQAAKLLKSSLSANKLNLYMVDRAAHNPHKTHPHEIVKILTNSLK